MYDSAPDVCPLGWRWGTLVPPEKRLMQKTILFLMAGAVLALSLGFVGSPAARAG